MFEKHEKSADPCPCLFCLLQPHCCCQCSAVSLDSSRFLLSTIVINQYFSFFFPKLFISEYVMKPLSGNVPSVSLCVCVWRVYLSSAFHSQKSLSEMPVPCLESSPGSCVKVQTRGAFQLCRAGLCFCWSVTTLNRSLFQTAECQCWRW